MPDTARGPDALRRGEVTSQSPANDDLDVPASVFRAEPPSGRVHVRRPGPAGLEEHLDMSCAEVAGQTVYQGDIWLGPALLLDKKMAVQFSLYITDAGYKWPGGAIPYEVDDTLRGVVMAAIAKLAAVTPLVLRPRAGERDFVLFQAGDLSGSFVGCKGGRQVISLTRDAGVGVALHEICHAFGLWHEQARPDRDRYITVHEENIRPGCRPQFDVETSNATSAGPYDYASIMHYPADAFALPGTVTITTRNGTPIGQRNGLSQGDIASLRAVYPSLDWR